MPTKTSENKALRFDLAIIASWIEPRSRVLDLGCGEGDLLDYLQRVKQVAGTGIERRETHVARCIEKGLPVIQGDINAEIHDYASRAFDYVILSRTLQQVYRPAELIGELLRVGRRGVVSFPNFSHWQARLQLMFGGYAPKTAQLPYEWHDTPNIRVITIKDFRRFLDEIGASVIRETAINTSAADHRGRIVRKLANWRATYGLFLIGRS